MQSNFLIIMIVFTESGWINSWNLNEQSYRFGLLDQQNAAMRFLLGFAMLIKY